MTAETDQRGPTGIVVGVDGSDLSVRALHWGAFLSESMQVDMTVVIAWHPLSLSSWGAAGWVAFPGEWDPESDAAAALDRAIASAFDSAVPRRLRRAVVEGAAAPALLELSANANMLVLGSRGHGGFAGLLLGSVSAACSQHAKVPVLVVHGDTPVPATG